MSENEVLERLNAALDEAFKRLWICKNSDRAKFLGCASSYYSEVINGSTNLSDRFLKNAAEKLQINSDWVRTGEGDMLNNGVIQNNNNGDNINGQNVNVNKSEDALLDLLKKKDEQIDKLLGIIEKMNG